MTTILQRALVITGGLIIAFALLDPPDDEPVVVPDPTPTIEPVTPVEPAKPEPPKYVASICKKCGAEWYGKTVAIIDACPKCPPTTEVVVIPPTPTDNPPESVEPDAPASKCHRSPRRRLRWRLRR